MIRRIPAKGIPENQLTAGPTLVGLDVAVNRGKGLRCSIRTRFGLWETTLKLKRQIRLSQTYPYVDIPLPNGEITAEYLLSIFVIKPGVAQSLSRAFRQAECAAIDSPKAFAKGESRTSENIWHKHLIPDIKPEEGGVLWTPSQRDMDAVFSLYFSGEDRCQLTTEQLTSLGQSLWMMVGFWLYEAFRRAHIRTIEVYPAALRAVCQHIAVSPFADELLQDFVAWGGAAEDYPHLMRTKSETNDAAICCFTAYLWTQGKTEELHPGEIVVPIHRGARFHPAAPEPATTPEPARIP